MRKLLIFVVVFGLAGGAAWWYTQGKPADNAAAAAKAKPGVKVSTAPVTKQDVPIEVNLVGNVYPYETVNVKSRIDSEVMDVRFKDGENVKEGQLLFQLDDRVLKAQLAEGQANYARDKAQYERYQTLATKGFASKEKLDDMRAAYEVQQATINSLRVQLDYTRITAPISGRAGTINVTRGNTVKANDTGSLVTINQVQPIRVQFAVPERYYEGVRTALTGGDMPVVVERKDNLEKITGAFEHMDNNVDSTSGTFAARAKFTNEDEKLWPGMFVNVQLGLGIEQGVLTVPVEAIQGDETNRYVYTVDGTKSVKKPVKLKRMTGALAVVDSGLAEGDQVITDGLLRVTDGGDVEINKPDAPKEKTAEKPADKETKPEAPPPPPKS